MSTQSGSDSPRTSGNALSKMGGILLSIGRRCYALTLILIVLWLSWLAVFYLVSALILPARPPKYIVDIPTRLDEATLMRPPSSKGTPSITNPRSPISHYHRLDKGFQNDPLNGCNISQCHAPLPHGKNKADRAFLNMHATSIHCAVCHVQPAENTLNLAWYDLKSGKNRLQAPALVQAYEWLTSPSVRNAKNFSINDQKQIVHLLQNAANEANGDSELISLKEHLAAVRATSEEFSKLVRIARNTCRNHFRGEYSAKLALFDSPSDKIFLGNLRSEDAVQDYLTRRDKLSIEEKKALMAKIHPKQRTPTLHCTQCHSKEKSLVDFAKIGYPPARIEEISSPLVTRAIENIVEGKPFYLPSFLDLNK